MSTAGAIRAGAAYVEAFLDDNPLNRKLAQVGAKLRAWSAGLASIGAKTYGGELPEPLAAVARFAQSPAGLFTGLLAAAKTAASAGGDMLKLAQQTGTTVEAISALAYAAKQSNTEVSSLAVGLKKMGVNIAAAASGSAQAREALAAIGLAVTDLANLSPDAQFRLIADRIAAIHNPTMRTAAAVKIFGKSGADLVPMMLEGARGIAALEARARELGITMDTETAEAADAFDDSIGDLKDVMGAGVRAIGGALVPALRGLTDMLVRGIAASVAWIKENRGLVGLVMAGTTAAVAFGAAFMVASKIVALGAMLVQGATVAFTVLKLAVVAASATMSLLLSPMGLVVAAAAGLGYALVRSGAAGSALASLRSAFSGVAQEATAAFGVISEALASGDIGTAVEVGVAFLKLEWQKAVIWLQGLWEGVKGWWRGVVFSLGSAMLSAVAEVRKAWSSALTSIQKAWNTWLASDVMKKTASVFTPVVAKAMGLTTEEVNAQLDQEFAQRNRTLGARNAGLDAENANAQQEWDKWNQEAQAALAADKQGKDRESADRLKALEKERFDAIDKWEGTLEEKKRKQAEDKKARDEKFKGVDLGEGKISVAGSFSSIVGSVFGGNAVMGKLDRVVEAADRQANETRKLRETVERKPALAAV